LRASLRQRLSASPLLDSRRVARAIEGAARDLFGRFALVSRAPHR